MPCMAMARPMEPLGLGSPRTRQRFSMPSHGRPKDTEVSSKVPSPDTGLEICKAVGEVKSFDASRGFGFITCKEVFEKYGRDVFVHKDQLGPFAAGDRVSFSVKTSAAGHPQAYQLSGAPKTLEKQGVKPEKADTGSGERHVGKVKSFNFSKGYGFIECAALHSRFGCDVFFPTLLLPGLKVHDDVEFQAEVKNGQPQAHGITAVKTVATKNGQPKAPGITAEKTTATTTAKVEFSAQATKKLLRACASSRKDSYDEMFELLNSGADPNGRDVTGQTALMVAALNTGNAEKKCRLLVGMGADVHAAYKEGMTVLEWARERLSRKLAVHLEALSRGEQVDCDIVLDLMGSSDV